MASVVYVVGVFAFAVAGVHLVLAIVVPGVLLFAVVVLGMLVLAVVVLGVFAVIAVVVLGVFAVITFGMSVFRRMSGVIRCVVWHRVLLDPSLPNLQGQVKGPSRAARILYQKAADIEHIMRHADKEVQTEMGGMMGGGSYGLGSLGILGMILNLVITVGVIVGIVLLVVWLVRRVAGDSGGATFGAGVSAPPNSAREILQVRYARGEIDREQYQEMLGDLS